MDDLNKLNDEQMRFSALLGLMLVAVASGAVPETIGTVVDGIAYFDARLMAREASRLIGQPVSTEEAANLLGAGLDLPVSMRFERIERLPHIFAAPTLKATRKYWDANIERTKWPAHSGNWTGVDPIEMLTRTKH